MGATRDEQPSRDRRQAVITAGCVVVVAAAVVVAVLGYEGNAPVATPSGSEAPTVIASAAGVEVTSALLTTDADPANEGAPDQIETIPAGGTVTAVVGFAYGGAREGQDSLFIVWLRGDEELQRNAFRLPQPSPAVNATLGPQHTDEPGDYRAEVRVGTTAASEVVLALEFEVRGG